MSNGYNVAFRNDIGVVTWRSFKSKADFDEQLKDLTILTVVEEGITEARAVELVKTTPPQSYTMTAMRNATDPKTGEVNPVILRHEMVKAVYGIRHSLS
jgi:hypothetical protein